MVAAHFQDLLAAGMIGHFLGAFGVGFAIGLLFTTLKKLGEKI